MGFVKPSPQPVEPTVFLKLPLRERVRILSTHWADDGFGTPRALHIMYIVKMLGLCFGVGIRIASATSGTEFTDIGSWYHDIVVHHKLAVWLMLLEVTGLGGAFGPLCGHFRPMIGNIRYWIRPGTVRMAPWGSRVPFTGGDERTWFDVALFAGVLAALVYPPPSSTRWPRRPSLCRASSSRRAPARRSSSHRTASSRSSSSCP
ncbi:DUF3556 domain-containing protein [Streptomyces thermoviolaceus]|uniref:DUF3556 domain-containing protein n=1 Tax=Streptomyces thermoviolaceus TaxID=1952 RepID=UPI003863722E|nr:DUF3556 domain-containing protein [Streptomyces thermoviolaceus]WTD50765.1 DUF3556 domain-containing protein [Streptomyces thermoviolaceus]